MSRDDWGGRINQPTYSVTQGIKWIGGNRAHGLKRIVGFPMKPKARLAICPHGEADACLFLRFRTATQPRLMAFRSRSKHRFERPKPFAGVSKVPPNLPRLACSWRHRIPVFKECGQ